CYSSVLWFVFCPYCFFFQAEDGIRDRNVTGVQTCALPIYSCSRKSIRIKSIARAKSRRRLSKSWAAWAPSASRSRRPSAVSGSQIGRASCRERVEMCGVEGELEEKRVEAEWSKREARGHGR